MLSINTNLSSLIAQGSLTNSTNKLNEAIERMSTGFKINHAKDNAANYSISTNMSTQLSAYDIAADNVAMGMDLVTTATDIVSAMQNHANRLHSLCTQARNGTYGQQSMDAINTEAGAIIAEINRLYSTAEYNDIALFDRKSYDIAPHLPQAGSSGFIDESAVTTTPEAKAEYNGFIDDPKTYEDTYVDGLKSVTTAVAESSLTSGGEYKVATKEDLVALATYVNGGNDTTGMTFILAEDIDLSSISNWTPIGDNSTSSARFKGTFDGNGHTISNLKINNPTADYQGLFGYASSSATIKNVGLKNVDVNGKGYVGGLVGDAWSTITNSYATGDVTGQGDRVGGLAGCASSTITNSYATGDVTGQGNYVAGLAGYTQSSITNSYATGNVTGQGNLVGGLAGRGGTITNSYATGDITGRNQVGGLAGQSTSTITNSYATGDVTGQGVYVGGLAGQSTSTITNSYATGNVTGKRNYVGGLAGYAYSTITNSYATGVVSGVAFVGGLVGYVSKTSGTLNISGSSSYSKVNGNDTSSTGSLFGGAILTSNGTSFGTLNITNCQSIAQDMDSIGGCFKSDYSPVSYDMSTMLAGIAAVELKNILTSLQVGINSDESCQIKFDTNFDISLGAIGSDISSDSALACINDFINLLSEKSTQLGAAQNRLESALESITVNLENLTSSRSTLRDADIAEVSSIYIQQQILQQAAATLMATANQNPSIALQLI